MTTSISAVNAGATVATAVKTSSLSDDTKARLEALGITVTEGMTESEARNKIAEAEEQKGAQNQQFDNQTESEILSEAKTLAAAMGVSVGNEDDITEILNNIGDEIEVMLEEAEDNPAILSQVSYFYSQLASLDERYDEMQTSQENMYSAMNMVSTSNKIILGLN